MAAEVVLDPLQLLLAETPHDDDELDLLRGTYTHTATLSPTEILHTDDDALQPTSPLYLTGTQTIHTTRNAVNAAGQHRLYKQYQAALIAEKQINDQIALLEQQRRNHDLRQSHVDRMQTISMQQQMLQHTMQQNDDRLRYNYMRDQITKVRRSIVQQRKQDNASITQQRADMHAAIKRDRHVYADRRAISEAVDKPLVVDVAGEMRERRLAERAARQQHRQNESAAIDFAQCQNTINRQVRNELMKQYKVMQADSVKYKVQDLKTQLHDTKQEYQVQRVREHKSKVYDALDLKYTLQQQLAERSIKEQQSITKQKQVQQYNKTIKSMAQDSIQPLIIDHTPAISDTDVRQLLQNSALLDAYINNSMSQKHTVDLNDASELMSDDELEQQIHLLKQLAIKVKEQYTNTGT